MTSETRVQVPTRHQPKAIQDLLDTYGSAYELLRGLADQLGVSLAYVDRVTVEAHLERRLSEAEWAATRAQFTAMTFDEHIGDHGTFRTDWIEDVLARAGIPGRGAQNRNHELTGEGRIPAGRR